LEEFIDEHGGGDAHIERLRLVIFIDHPLVRIVLCGKLEEEYRTTLNQEYLNNSSKSTINVTLNRG